MTLSTAITISVAALVVGLIVGIAILYWRLKDRSEMLPYPFDNPDFIHVGINLRQTEALKPLATELRFLGLLPQHKNDDNDDITFFAMNRGEFIYFFGLVSRHMSELVATAARNQEAFLKGDTFILYDMLVGLSQIRARIDSVSAATITVPLAVDSRPN